MRMHIDRRAYGMGGGTTVYGWASYPFDARGAWLACALALSVAPV